MATREASNYNGDIFFNDSGDGNQYQNLNLNQNNHKICSSNYCNNLTEEKMTSNQKWNSKKETDLQYPRGNFANNSSWKNSSNFRNFDIEHKKDETEKTNQQNYSNPTSSTLDLHIESYENSVKNYCNENENEENGDVGKNERRKKELKTWKEGKQCITEENLVNGFEFPRQQNEQINDPEIMQFKASQKLLNPDSDEVVLDLEQLFAIFSTEGGYRRCFWREQILQATGFSHYITSPKVLTNLDRIKAKFVQERKKVKKELFGRTTMIIGSKKEWETQHYLFVAENERLYSVENLIPLHTERSSRQDAIRHTVTSKIFDGCYDIVPLFYKNIAEYLEKQMMLVLPEGENMDQNLKDQLASASGTNKIAEQVFGIASFLRRLSGGKSTERITSNAIVVKNGTVDWFESKSPEEKKAIIKAMKKTRAAQRLQLKKDKKQLQEELAKKYKENQAKQQKKKVKTVEIDLDQYIGSRFHERWDEQADLWMYGYIQKKDEEGYIVYFYGDEEPIVYPPEYLKYQFLCGNIIFRD